MTPSENTRAALSINVTGKDPLEIFSKRADEIVAAVKKITQDKQMQNMGIQKSASMKITDVPALPRVKLSFATIALVFIVLRRGLKQKHEKRRGSCAILIQSTYRAYKLRQEKKKLQRGAIVIQSLMRMKMAMKLKERLKIARQRDKLQSRRANIIFELYQTELSYVQQLEILCKFFIKPLRALEKRAGVSAEQIHTIFGNVEEIYEKHVEFLESFGPLAKNFNDKSIVSTLFVKMSQWLGIYIPYCNNFEDAKSMLQKCQKVDKFSNFMLTIDATKILQRQDLSSFLILPIQRIPRYELLIKDLIRSTWEEHPDYHDLEAALSRIHDAARTMNRAKSFNESRHRIASLQIHISGSSNRLGGSFGSFQSVASPTSPTATTGSELEEYYIGEGPLSWVELEKKVTSKQISSIALDIDDMLTSPDVPAQTVIEYRPSGQVQQAYGYLFHNSIILTKRPNATEIQKIKSKSARSKTVKQSRIINISLERATVGFFRQNDITVATGSNKKEEPAFTITTGDGRMHKLTADTHELRKKWMSDINEAMAKLEQSKHTDQGDIHDLLASTASEESIQVTPIIITPSDSASSPDEPGRIMSKSVGNLKGSTDLSVPNNQLSTPGGSPLLAKSPRLRRLGFFKSHEVLDKDKDKEKEKEKNKN